MNAAGEMEVDDLRIEPLAAGGAPLKLPEALAPARSAEAQRAFQRARRDRAQWPVAFHAGHCRCGEGAHECVGLDLGARCMEQDPSPPGIAAAGSSQAWSEFDPETNIAGWYERSFTIPQEWHGRQILLDLQRVSTDAVVTCNGIEVGQVKWPGGVVDVTKSAKAGENTLRMLVVATQTEKESANLMGVGAGQVSKSKTKLEYARDHRRCGHQEPAAGRRRDGCFREDPPRGRTNITLERRARWHQAGRASALHRPHAR